LFGARLHNLARAAPQLGARRSTAGLPGGLARPSLLRCSGHRGRLRAAAPSRVAQRVCVAHGLRVRACALTVGCGVPVKTFSLGHAESSSSWRRARGRASVGRGGARSPATMSEGLGRYSVEAWATMVRRLPRSFIGFGGPSGPRPPPGKFPRAQSRELAPTWLSPW
jgi:hypothetical protein